MSRKAAQDETSRPNQRMKRSSIDFLSELPDDILLRILSYLPADEAVRSSSLSRRWRHLSSLLPVHPHLRLGASICPKDSIHPLRYFVFGLSPSTLLDPEYIERALTTETTLLTACEIIPDAKSDARQVASWSEALARRGVRELLIDFKPYYGPDASSVVVRCKSLDKLELRSCSLSRKSPVGCIFLTHLRLVGVEVSDEMLLGFASECKSLTSLELIGCYGFKELRLEDAGRLKRLSFQGTAEATRDYELERIEMAATNLEVLELRAAAMRGGIDIVAPRLRSALVCLSRARRRYFSRMAPGLWKIISGAADISCLQLRGAAMDCLSCNGMPDNFNMSFRNLRRLYISLVPKSPPQALCLAIFLQNSSILEQLNLVIVKGEVKSAEATPPKAMFEESARRLQIYPCIRVRLQHVTISGFTGEPYEMSLSHLVLRRAQALRKMSISLSKSCSEEGKTNAESLSRLATASPGAKVLIKRTH